MSWAEFYQLCFVVGFLLSFVLFFGGLHWHLHWPFGGNLGHMGAGTSHAAGAHGAHIAGARIGTSGPQIHVVNPFTLSVFLAWFGGAGFLLTKYHPVWAWMSFLFATAAGATGAAIVFWFLARFLTSPNENMHPADYEMQGVLGRVSQPIRAGGTGEIIFAQQGTRRVSGARSETGSAIAKNAEVIVTHYDKGLAYVRPWDEMVGSERPASGQKAASSTNQ